MKKALFIALIFTLTINVQLFSKDTTPNYFKKANTFFDKGEYRLAILYFDSAIVENPELVDAYALRGVSHYELKHFQSAIEDFNLALILQPNYAEVLFYRGLSYNQTEKPKLACEDWTKAYNLGFKKALKFIMRYCEMDDKAKKKK